ncbi:hypothetical protein ACTJJ7_04225 [Phyllobacterium sp. 22229]|uniref:hypothetical protein n=1 Tax=Phyllobacterium sp. 22229 TaxID=3453895 RepID=UPI003F8569B1
MKYTLRCLVPATFLVLAAQGGQAWAEGDTYTAYSNTAQSITGDITMDDFSITFANGEALAFSSLLGDHFIVDGKSVNASVYKVETPADPELENGNKLCGSGDVSYVATWGAGEGLTEVAVFTGGKAPSSNSDMCASYIYQD